MKYSYTHSLRLYLRYIVFGSLSYLIDLGVFLLLYSIVYAPLLLSTSVAFICGLLFSFITNKLFVFKARKETHTHKTVMQIVLYGALVIFNLIFTYIFVTYTITAGLSPAVSKTFATICVTLWNFILYNKVIFKKSI